MDEPAYAKINLALHVRAREPDGYHRIETLFAFLEEGDSLSVAEDDGLSLAVTGPFADALGDPADNLVLKAASALRPEGSRGAALTLDKRLPVASGIGGGSADAAAALRLLARWWNVPEGELEPIAARLGADVPACLLSRTAFGEGRGDRLRPVDEPGLASTPILLVNPGVGLSTGVVFRAWDECDRGPLAHWHDGRNDLEPAARALVPQIGAVLAALDRAGAQVARMSGSGATCFGLFATPEARDAAMGRIASAQPSWWTLPGRLR